MESNTKPKSKAPQLNGGPVVKTGPTAGAIRSRNDNGQWRKKRSDTGATRGNINKKGGK